MGTTPRGHHRRQGSSSSGPTYATRRCTSPRIGKALQRVANPVGDTTPVAHAPTTPASTGTWLAREAGPDAHAARRHTIPSTCASQRPSNLPGGTNSIGSANHATSLPSVPGPLTS